MITYNEANEFLDMNVDIAVHHRTLPGQYFWFYGLLIKVTEGYCKIKIRDGYKTIFLEDIQAIHKRRGRF